MAQSTTVTVSILDKDYQVSCGEDEVAALKDSARYLDQKMREIKASSNVLGLDRLAVMTALNIVHELIAQNESQASLVAHHESALSSLDNKLSVALNRLKSI